MGRGDLSLIGNCQHQFGNCDLSAGRHLAREASNDLIEPYESVVLRIEVHCNPVARAFRGRGVVDLEVGVYASRITARSLLKRHCLSAQRPPPRVSEPRQSM